MSRRCFSCSVTQARKSGKHRPRRSPLVESLLLSLCLNNGLLNRTGQSRLAKQKPTRRWFIGIFLVVAKVALAKLMILCSGRRSPKPRAGCECPTTWPLDASQPGKSSTRRQRCPLLLEWLTDYSGVTSTVCMQSNITVKSAGCRDQPKCNAHGARTQTLLKHGKVATQECRTSMHVSANSSKRVGWPTKAARQLPIFWYMIWVWIGGLARSTMRRCSLIMTLR
mmetsp:Transcript_119022/g.206680  ORF Transcript_119022/g.206680 Transcript_119022/m.206680 type:complete len:224 (+) Transcript_119022:106-777(+)